MIKKIYKTDTFMELSASTSKSGKKVFSGINNPLLPINSICRTKYYIYAHSYMSSRSGSK